jgi:hypothetical protein
MEQDAVGAEFAGEFDSTFVDADDDIRQGDLLQLVTQAADDRDEWESHFGVIVTADCDLAFGKHGGVLSYVPIVPLDVYTRLIAVPRILDAEMTQAQARLAEALPGDEGWPTLGRLIELIALGESAETVVGLLPASDETEAVGKCVARIAAAAQARSSYDQSLAIHDCVAHADRLMTAVRAIEGHKPLPEGALVKKELRARLLKQLPGDCLFLGRLTGSDDKGYAAYLRLVREISHDAIARSAVEERRIAETVKARRIGRLQLIYLHRLAQQMAQVFTDIGLPTEYESHRDGALDATIDHWSTFTTQSDPARDEPTR